MVTDTVIRCFCEDIKTIKASNIVNIGEDQVQKFYTIFRTLIYQRQKRQLDSYYSKQQQKARHRKFFNQEVYLYFYFNHIFISETLLKSENDRIFSSKEKSEFTTIYCYLSRNLTHNTNANNLNYKIAETLWRRKRDFKDLCFDLKSFICVYYVSFKTQKKIFCYLISTLLSIIYKKIACTFIFTPASMGYLQQVV